MSIVYDAAVLIGADRGDRQVWARHRARLEEGVLPLTTAPVVAQASRSTRQVRLRRFLTGCRVVAFEPESAHHVGELLGRARTSDVVDAHLLILAAETGSTLVTSDHEDLRALSDALGSRVKLRTL